MSSTPLGEKIRRLIEANGPIRVDEYMRLCLGDPQHGYYVARQPIGAAGDFVTAPEMSQMFGEILGAWLVHVWELMGAPAAVRLVELGPGRGALIEDVLRVAARRPAFGAAISLDLVEQSPVLRQEQARALAAAGAEATWRADFDAVPAGPLLLVANEFFDALPIRQFVRQDAAWRERMVGLDAAGELAFGLGPSTMSGLPVADESAVKEISPPAVELVGRIAARIVREGGAALIVDYGYSGEAFGDTLQAVAGHAFADPLARPGEADLTAHVDFSALARRARAEGASVHGPIGQGDFLLSLGLRQRAERLAEKADAPTRAAVAAAVERLAGTSAMGRLFKVLAIARPGLSPPPFAAV